MPGFDRTGPQGQGSQKGRGLGKCNPNIKKSDEQNATNEFSIGRAMRRGRGLFKGFRFGKGRGSGLDKQ